MEYLPRTITGISVVLSSLCLLCSSETLDLSSLLLFFSSVRNSCLFRKRQHLSGMQDLSGQGKTVSSGTWSVDVAWQTAEDVGGEKAGVWSRVTAPGGAVVAMWLPSPWLMLWLLCMQVSALHLVQWLRGKLKCDVISFSCGSSCSCHTTFWSKAEEHIISGGRAMQYSFGVKTSLLPNTPAPCGPPCSSSRPDPGHPASGHSWPLSFREEMGFLTWWRSEQFTLGDLSDAHEPCREILGRLRGHETFSGPVWVAEMAGWKNSAGTGNRGQDVPGEKGLGGTDKAPR